MDVNWIITIITYQSRNNKKPLNNQGECSIVWKEHEFSKEIITTLQGHVYMDL
jgi:hypothetical protein